MLSWTLLVLQITGCLAQPLRKTLRVGMMFVENEKAVYSYVGYRTSASAVLIAKDRITREGLLPGIDFEFFYAFDECNERKAAGIAVAMNEDLHVDVILGPTCNTATLPSAIIAGYYNKPLFTWGLSTSSEFGDVDRFPSVGATSINSLSLSMALCSVLQHFGWDQFAFIFAEIKISMCSMMRNDMQNVIAQTDGVSINYFGEISAMNPERIESVLTEAAKRARIMIVCIPEDSGFKRMFMLSALDSSFLNSEFVYILASPNSKGFLFTMDGKPRAVWEDVNTPGDGRNDEAFSAFRKIMIVSSYASEYDEAARRSFGEQVIARMKDPPFLCTTACQGTQNSVVSQYADQLHDAFYAYARALNITLSRNASNISNATALLQNIEMTFEGASGVVNFNKNGTRNPTFFVNILYENNSDRSIASISVAGKNLTFTQFYEHEEDLWFTQGGIRPPAVPKCGFNGKQCPPDFVTTYLLYVIIGAVIVIFCIVMCIAGISYSVVNKRAEIERLNQMWQISFFSLMNISTTDKTAASYRSLQSNESSMRTNKGVFIERRNYSFYLYKVQ